METFYNDNDKKTCLWLRSLIANKNLTDGVVDDRDIEKIKSEEIKEYRQAHFFAGIGGWGYALRLAGWGDRPVWTGSCPCQPFSTAGKRKGKEDSRHLWPEFFRLIKECRPPTIFGEQVAGKSGLGWLDGVFTDLEGEGYACGAADLCAAGEGSPHIRQRIFWVANANDRGEVEIKTIPTGQGTKREGSVERMGDAFCQRLEGCGTGPGEQPRPSRSCESLAAPGSWRGKRLATAWDRFDVVRCRDEKTRRFEPESFPVAPRIPGTVAALRGYGNSIVPQVAATFIRAFMEAQ